MSLEIVLAMYSCKNLWMTETCELKRSYTTGTRDCYRLESDSLNIQSTHVYLSSLPLITCPPKLVTLLMQAKCQIHGLVHYRVLYYLQKSRTFYWAIHIFPSGDLSGSKFLCYHEVPLRFTSAIPLGMVLDRTKNSWVKLRNR